MMSVLQRFWVLYTKEWARLKRNPAAFMSVGLLVIVAYLVSIETQSQAKQANAAKKPCVVVYNQDDDLIVQLKRMENTHIKLVQTDDDIATQQFSKYPKGVNCAAQYSNRTGADKALILLQHGDDTKQIYAMLKNIMSAHAHDQVVIKSKKLMTSEPAKKSTAIDLGSKQSRAMVWAMLLFSVQYFVCCALFISFSAHERERGILQALVLTPVSLNAIWLAKAAFHLSVSMAASFVMIGILNANYLTFIPLWLILICSSLGLISVATIITSLNRTQTAASLMGFCYLMAIAVVFALAKNFHVFGLIKNLMFESHVIASINAMFDTYSKQNAVLFFYHFIYLLVLTPLLVGVALWVWNKRVWRNV